VNKGAFCESVSFDYWGDVLPSSFNDAKPYIDRIRDIRGMGCPLPLVISRSYACDG
jgi:hypothetical protein